MSFHFSYRSKKLLILLLVVVAFANLIYQYSDYSQLEEATLNRGKEFAISKTKEIEKDINSMLSSIEKEAQIAMDEILQKESLSDADLVAFCRKKGKRMPELLGVTVSFEPYQYKSDERLRSIYFDKNMGQAIRIDTIYDYTDSSLATAQWYTQVIEKNKAIWTQPYFAGGAKNLVTDYSAPITKNGRTIGVITYTLSVNNLMGIMHDISLGKGGYGFLINQSGTVITHPNSDFVLKKNLKDVFNNDSVIDTILTKKNGFTHKFKINEQRVSLCFYELGNQDWKLVTVFSDMDLFENNQELKDKLINLFIAVSLFMALVLLLIIIQKGISKTEAWTFSYTITFMLIANIIFVWYLNLNDRYDTEKNTDIIITDKSTADNFVAVQNAKRKQFSIEPLVEIPTGIFLEKIDYEDSYNVGISGWIWQKYPKKDSIEPALYFPQLSPFAEAHYLEKVNQVVKDDYVLVKWYFRSTFIFNFNYRKYPFNTKTVKLKVAYPGFDNNYILTPEIQTYPSFNASELPGISKDSRTSSLRYISSKFSFTTHHLSGNLDSQTLAEMGSVPMLQFEIKTRKPFLNAFIKQMIPITLVSLMIYLLLFNLREDNVNRRTVGIEAIAGLLFILVLSHIDFRKTIFSPNITYLESFYFVIYFMIAVIAVNIVLFDLSRINFLTRNSNKFLKLVYWPFFFFTIFVVTLLVFY